MQIDRIDLGVFLGEVYFSDSPLVPVSPLSVYVLFIFTDVGVVLVQALSS